MEGTLLGIRSIALSQAYNFVNEERIVPYATCEALGPALLERVLKIDLPAGVFLNLNFPSCAPEKSKGTVVTSQGKLIHGLGIEKRADGRGLPYYWLRFSRQEEVLLDGTDLHAVKSDFVSVTPLKLDLTAHEMRDELARALA